MFLSKLFKSKTSKWLTALGAFAMAMGVGASVFSINSSANHETETANAATATTVYYAVSSSTVGSYTVKCNVNRKGDGDDWAQYNMTKKDGWAYDGKDIYVVNFTDLYNGLGCLQFQLYNGGSWVSQQQPIGEWTAASTYNGKMYVHDQAGWKELSHTSTITFHQNDGTGYKVSKTKTFGTSYSIPSLASLAMGASEGRYFLRWSTKSDGSGYTYNERDSYTTEDNLDLHMIQDWYVYEYSDDGGSSWIPVTTHSGSTPYSYIAQFETPSSNELKSGSSLTFRRYYGSGAHTSVSINSWDGNCDGGTVKYTFSGKVYVKVKSNGDLDVNVEGDMERQIFVNSTPYSLEFGGSTTDGHTTVPVALSPGDIIKGGYNGGSYSLPGTISGDGNFSKVGGDVTCNAPGVFTIHLLGGGGDFPNVQFVMEAAASANLFARTFNSAISAVCTGITGGTKSTTDLVTDWGATSASGQNKNYNSLTSATKELLVADSSDTDIAACIKKYDYVCGKYGTNGMKITGMDDFMGRNPSAPSSAGVIPGAPSPQESPLTVTLWVVLGSGLAGLAAIGSAYFISKRKKRNRA